MELMGALGRVSDEYYSAYNAAYESISGQMGLGDWNLYMRDCPLFQAEDLDDLFELLDSHLRLHDEDDIAGNIQTILGRITRKVCE